MRWLLPIGVLAAAAWWLTRMASAVPPETLEHQPGVAWTVFDCAGERRFAARVGEGGTEVYFPSGERATIPDGESRAWAGGVISIDGQTASFAKGGARIDCDTRTAALQIELGPTAEPVRKPAD